MDVPGTEPGGYRLDIGKVELGLRRFDDLRARPRRAGPASGVQPGRASSTAA
jgi:hypothetical protein